ncbi:hypothetical protein C1637_18930 [Chryseobacterium lactis]|uniref:Uncharacterized protein n=1 Tax=Chryseobacterium lactis TaxID=1241981 RepID=A0A3G6RK54_CHRLC|nr:hypothetical protein [Chryseobacterium lactis]AZA84857.1 hypothetical protein EG342_24440 [Chryseobacterium lactis]AZB05245.1 hypothetical protein EG341_15320 [Chryseobacterium lactis]PNW12228.1 hypothetical protein C1637_18930 [Chryseobacterium lactis]
MKIKLNHKILTLLFIVCFSLYFGQKTEFTIPKSIETLQNAVFYFSNEFTKDEAKAAAASDDNFSTTVDLYNLKYDAGYKNPYLKLALKNGAQSKQFIQQAVWNVTMKKISKKSTKVSIFLQTVTPDRWSKKDVDVKQTQSTGKVEQEIKEFLLNYKEPKVSEALAAAIGATDAAAAEAMATAQVTDFETRNSVEKVTSKKLQSLFSKKEFISLPTISEKFTKLLQIQSSEQECEDCKKGKYSSWDFDDFNMIYTQMNDGKEYYALQYYGDQKVSGLPYGLVFNDSSPTECKTKFARYNAQLYQTTVDTDESSSKALTVVTFKISTSFVRLEFGNGYLTRLVISNKEF